MASEISFATNDADTIVVSTRMQPGVHVDDLTHHVGAISLISLDGTSRSTSVIGPDDSASQVGMDSVLRDMLVRTPRVVSTNAAPPNSPANPLAYIPPPISTLDISMDSTIAHPVLTPQILATPDSVVTRKRLSAGSKSSRSKQSRCRKSTVEKTGYITIHGINGSKVLNNDEIQNELNIWHAGPLLYQDITFRSVALAAHVMLIEMLAKKHNIQLSHEMLQLRKSREVTHEVQSMLTTEYSRVWNLALTAEQKHSPNSRSPLSRSTLVSLLFTLGGTAAAGEITFAGILQNPWTWVSTLDQRDTSMDQMRYEINDAWVSAINLLCQLTPMAGAVGIKAIFASLRHSQFQSWGV